MKILIIVLKHTRKLSHALFSEHYKENRVIQRFSTVVYHTEILLNIETISDTDNREPTVIEIYLQQQLKTIVKELATQ